VWPTHILQTIEIDRSSRTPYDATAEEIDDIRLRLKIAASIFGRPTPVELEFSQVQKSESTFCLFPHGVAGSSSERCRCRDRGVQLLLGTLRKYPELNSKLGHDQPDQN